MNIMFNFQSIARSKQVAVQHYDLPDILYDNMLDQTKCYSCGYFKDTDDLHQAQINKCDLIIEKLHIKDGHRILEIGSGWGFMSARMAQKYPNSHVVGLTISAEQISYCQKTYSHLHNLTFELKDYRLLEEESFDRITSTGFFEHINYKSYDKFINLM